MLLLLTRPKYDHGTHYLFHWAEDLVQEAINRKVDVIDLKKKKVIRKNFQSYLAKQPVDLVIINGHGGPELVTGHEDDIILAIGDGDKHAKNKIIYIRACDSGSILGPHLMSLGAKGFVGYCQPFIFARDPDMLHTPLKDEYARPVMECSNQVALSLIKGKSVTQAHEDSLVKYREKIDEYSNSKTAASFILPFLLWNMSCQVCFSL